jgi:hypothetical protein
MTSDDLIDRFVRALVRDWGRDRRHWRRVIGPVKVYSLDTHAHCNWHVTPSGTAGENAAVERIADRLRGEVPIVEA